MPHVAEKLADLLGLLLLPIYPLTGAPGSISTGLASSAVLELKPAMLQHRLMQLWA
jgi:hypothetical protein